MQLGRHFLLIIMANIRGISLTNRVPTSLPGTRGIKLFSYRIRSSVSLDCPGMASAVVRTHNYCGKQRGSCPLCRYLRTRIVTVCVVRKLYRMHRHDIVGIQRQGVCERRSKNLNMVMKSNN